MNHNWSFKIGYKIPRPIMTVRARTKEEAEKKLIDQANDWCHRLGIDPPEEWDLEPVVK